jgi:hypothetical protein
LYPLAARLRCSSKDIPVIMGRCGWKSSFNRSGAKAVEYSRSQYTTHLLSVLPGKRSIVNNFQEEKKFDRQIPNPMFFFVIPAGF